LAEYEQRKQEAGDEKAPEPAPPLVDSTPATKPAKPTPAKGGFTAVQSSPLALNPDAENGSDDEAEDEATVAADLGGSQPAPTPKRQRRESAKSAETPKKEKKEKAKEKEKEKDKDKRKRRKSGKSES